MSDSVFPLFDRMVPAVVWVRHHRTKCLVGLMRDWETNRRVVVSPLWTWVNWPLMSAGWKEIDGKKYDLCRRPCAMIGDHHNERCLLVPYAAHLHGVRGFDLI